jgi:hypothetical protein
MGNVDLGDLRKRIDELDKLLISGTLQYRAMYGDYSTARKNEGFDVAVYTGVGRKVWVEWQDKCFAIFEKLPRQHYAFHFAQTKSDGMSIMGWPDALSTVKMHFERQLHALEEIILWLEENEGLALRKEIADKEYQADIIYQIRYSEHSREIKLNNILLSKPDFDRENERCFGYIFANPGRVIGKAELEKVNGEPLKKPIKHILRDLGFVGDVAKIFTPGISEKSVEFVNPITKQYHYKHDLPVLDFTMIGRNREKSGDVGKKSVK